MDKKIEGTSYYKLQLKITSYKLKLHVTSLNYKLQVKITSYNYKLHAKMRKIEKVYGNFFCVFEELSVNLDFPGGK